MKRSILISIVAVSAMFLSSCDSQGPARKVSSQGSPYEIIIVSNNNQWESSLGDTLRNILIEPVQYINSLEPSYDVRRIMPGSFNGLVTKHRNLLFVRTGEEYREPAMTASYDTYASPQIVVTLAGPDNATLARYITEYAEELRSIFEQTERDRTLVLNKSYGDKKISEEIYSKFGFRMDLPKGYSIRNGTPEDFMWLSFEYPRASQGIVIYSYPYTDREDFTVESLIRNRNRFVSLIPGENEGSYMTSYDGFVPELKHIRVDGRYWAEMRGFWDVENDYMGGPYVSYSTLDTESNRVVTLDFYVYSPDKPKRNFLRQLEHIIYSVKFPGDNQ